MRALLIVLPLLLTASAQAAIEDNDPRVPNRIASIGATSYFAGVTGAAGRELWRTDGTSSGTVLVRDIAPGTAGSDPKHLISLGSLVFFSADDGVNGRELWASDGTSAGTTLFDLSPGAASSNPHHLTVTGSRLFFAAETPGTGWRLWVSNGTLAGTQAVADPLPSTSTDEFDYNWHHSFCGAVTLLFFNATDPVGNRLWVSDGTALGTHAVLPTAGPGNQPIALGALGDRCFYASVNDNSQLWSSDGTPAGTSALPGGVRAADFNTGINGHVFTRGTTGAYTNGIYVSDVTLSAPILTSTTVSAPSYFWDVAGRAFTDVDVSGSSDRQLVVSDGTAVGTQVVSSMPTFGLHMPVGNLLYFTSTVSGVRQLWRTDGTALGTTVATTVISDPVPVGAVGGKVLATHLANWNSYDQLWVSDGTPAGTIQIMPPAIGSTTTSGGSTTSGSTTTSGPTTSGGPTTTGSTTTSASGGSTAPPPSSTTGPHDNGSGTRNFFCGFGNGGALSVILLLLVVRRARFRECSA